MPFGSFKCGLWLFLFIVSLPLHAQSTSQRIYTKLDTYIEEANEKHYQALKQELEAVQEGEDSELQLAQVIAYCNIGYIQSRENKNTEAIQSYETAKTIFLKNKLQNYDIIEYALKPLGNLYTRIYAFTEAESTLKEYLLLAREQQNTSQEKAAVLNLSTLYFTQGKFNKSKLILEEALEKEPENKELLSNYASTLFAVNESAQAERIVRQLLPDAHWKTYKLLAQIQLAQKDYKTSILSLQKAEQRIEAASQDPEARAEIQLALAEVYVRSGNRTEAQKHLTKVYQNLVPDFRPAQSHPDSTQLFPDFDLMETLDLHAFLAEKEGDLALSLELYEQAHRVNDFLFDQLLLHTDKYSLLQNHKIRNEKIINLLYNQHETNPNDKIWIEKAIELIHKTNGRIAQEERRRKRSIMDFNPDVATKIYEIQNRLHQVKKEINRQIVYDENENRIAVLQKEYSTNLSELHSLYKRLKASEDSLSTLQNTPSLARLQEKAKENESTLVLYFYGEQSIFQFILSSEDYHFNKLTQSKEDFIGLEEQLIAFLHSFDHSTTINNNLAAFRRSAFELYQQLNLPQTDNLVILPDGILSFLPFQALLTQSVETSSYSEMPFLVMKGHLYYLTALSEFLNPEEISGKNKRILGVFPVFKDTANELTYSMDEAKSIQNYFSGNFLLKEHASTANFIRESKNYPILHLSSHAAGGSFNQEAYLQFADDLLTLTDINNLFFQPDLVVLSACETGIGKITKGEGPLSLARGFTYAGAKNILFSLWEINDKSTSIWMDYYYRYLKRNNSQDLAVSLASQAYLQNPKIDNISKSPYYWASFVYYGQHHPPSSSDSIRDSLLNWKTLGWIGITVLCLFFIFYFIYHKNIEKKRQ